MIRQPQTNVVAKPGRILCSAAFSCLFPPGRQHPRDERRSLRRQTGSNMICPPPIQCWVPLMASDSTKLASDILAKRVQALGTCKGPSWSLGSCLEGRTQDRPSSMAFPAVFPFNQVVSSPGSTNATSSRCQCTFSPQADPSELTLPHRLDTCMISSPFPTFLRPPPVEHERHPTSHASDTSHRLLRAPNKFR